MTTIDIELDDREVRRALRRIAGALADPSPAMRAIATRLADRAEDAFETQASPGGMPWPALKPATERARNKSGHVPITILQRSGALVRSILADWSPTEAVAGTNLVYAATHQFGDPERNIPARPFLGASGEDNRFIVDTLIRHLDPDRS